MSTSALESEDLENVPLVRMEDVQPSRTYELISRRRSEEVLGTCVIEDIEYDNECIVNDDDDSNIGSMVSIQSEEINEDSSEAEMIVPEPLESPAVQIKLERQPPSSWPTLEILPGGVIKKPEKLEVSATPYYSTEDCPSSYSGEKSVAEEMMYACAKCSQRFKFLFCLVKHVKWHEDEAKKLMQVQEVVKVKPKPESRDYVCKHANKRKMVICMKTPKKRSPKKLKMLKS